MRNYRIWERATLGMGIVGAMGVAVGLGYLMGDYALGLLFDGRQAGSRLSEPKAPLMVRDTVEPRGKDVAVSAQEDARLYKVRIDIKDERSVGAMEERLEGFGLPVHAPKEAGWIQVGAFRDKTKAETLVKLLVEKELPAYIM